MDIYGIIVIVALAASLILGFLLGFGRTLKFVTKGIVGIIFSVFFCFMFGGVIAKIPFVAELIELGNTKLGEKAEILAKMHVITIIYYVVLFFVFQLLRILIVKVIAGLFTPKNKEAKTYKVRNIINRVLGTVLFGAFVLFTIYLIMAILALLPDVNSVNTFLTESAEKGTFFYKMYSHNPINLVPLFN